MRRSASLLPLQKRILDHLSKNAFATPEQLGRLCNSKAPNISTAVKELLNVGLVDGSLLTRPMILHLTHAGGRLLDVPMPSGRRHSSWSVMAHACHLNAAGEILASENNGFRFLSRLTMLKQGLNPGHGDHGAVDDSGTSWYVLLDDYMMGSDRIKRSWTRRHTPTLKYWPDHTGRAWSEMVQRFMVVTTDADQAARHQKWILKDQLPADVMIIKPLWKS
jgi:hypothetical protein